MTRVNNGSAKLSVLKQALRSCRGAFYATAVFSFFINLLMFVQPLYMLQVYDRVLVSRSEQTLVLLTAIAGGMLLLMALLELVRSRVLVRVGAHLDRQLSLRVFRAVFDPANRKAGVGPMIVISTPLTGWFHCGGERGPGIALWLRMAALLARQSRPVLMLGTGSHEIGHLGMEHALKHGAPSPDQVQLWVHFGASLGATRLDARHNYKSGQYLVGTETTAVVAKEKLLSVMPFYVPGDSKTLGEAGQVIGAGHARFIGMSGQFPTFHTPLDKGEAIDFAQLERIAVASEALFAS